MKWYLLIAGLLIVQLNFAQEIPTNTSPKIWSLEECINYALENNITVKEAGLNREQAQVNLNKAKDSRLPNLYGSASQNFSNGNSIDPITSDFVPDQTYSTNVGINTSVTLFQGKKISNEIEQSSLLFKQSTYLEEAQKNNIVLNILETYIQTLFSKENITIAQSNLEASQKEVLRAKARLDAETIALNDYTEAQSQEATNRFNLINAKNSYQQNIIALKQLLELPPSEELEIETINQNIDLINLNLNKIEIYNKAIAHLPEIEASKLGVEVSKKELDIAKSAYMPSLSLNGNIGTGYTSHNSNSFSKQFDINFNQRIGLSLNVPIFNRNQTKAAVKSATINIQRAELQKYNTEKELYRKIETTYRNALSAQEQVIAAQVSKEAAEQSYKLAQKRYQLGDLSTTDLVISQNTYINAQQNYLQAKYLNILYHQLLQFYQGNEIKF